MADKEKDHKDKKKEKPPEAAETKPVDKEVFPVVGIGASAGGIEALQQVFESLSPELETAFVLVQHLQPDRPSMLVEILSRATAMPVVQAEEGMKIEGGRVYAIPPDRFLSLKEGHLRLTPPPTAGVVRMPIDFLFRSIAEEKHEAAIGIILSGSGSDGTMGLRAIHEAGGLTIVQEPASAHYPQMPESALSTGIVDHVASAGQIGALLERYVKRMSSLVKVVEKPEAVQTMLDPVLAVLAASRHDFSHYKMNTIARRIARRMNIANIHDPREYVRYIQEHREETGLLVRDLLIRVTSFFRDPEGYHALEKEVLPRLLSPLPEGHTVRVWVPGCSTGEEAYSLAILLEEYNEAANKRLAFQIFATDLDEPSVGLARGGFYPLDIAADVSEERLHRFFAAEETGYRVKKDLRERIVFAVQDVLKDPPFTKLDIVSCRNLLIYLRSEAQKRLLETFHYSLRTGGVLFLGASETIGSRSDLFETIGKKWKFYEARPSQRLPAFQPDTRITPYARPPQTPGAPARKEPGLREAATREILDHYSPPSVVVDETGNIMFFHGQTGRYLEPPLGEARFSVYDMAKGTVRFGIHAAVRQAMAQKSEALSQMMTVKVEGAERGVRVRAKPLPRVEGCYMVVFEEVALPEHKTEGKGGAEEDKRAEQLEEELFRTRSELQTTVEEFQAAMEEQKSTSEELQSSNEELQSTNEELETSKEEIQSVNEELVTVNTELESKIQQLSIAESDMKNLLDSVSVGAVFVDSDLRIKRFTEEVKGVANLILSDVGRPLRDIATRIEDENIAEAAKAVLDTLQAVEKEVRNETGDWYLMRIKPYRTRENVIGGVVITFNNVTPVKKASEERATAAATRAVVDTVGEPLLTLSSDLRIVTANRAFCSLFNVEKNETEGKLAYDVADGQLDVGDLRRLLEQVLSSNSVVEDYPVSVARKDTEPEMFLLTARTLMSADNVRLPFVIIGIREAGGRGKTLIERK